MSSTATAPELKAKKNSRPSAARVDDAFFAERVLALALIVIVALWIRLQGLGLTTAYMDESVYIVYGRMFLARHFEAPLDSPLRWSFGWYLWPIISAWTERLGGILAVRALAGCMGTAAVVAVWGFSRRLFGNATAIGSAAVFAVIAPAVLASRIATRDAGAIFFFTFGLWAYARAWQENERKWWSAAAVLLFCAFLCKYIVAIYFPLLCILSLRRVWRPLFLLCAPMTAASAFYLYHYWGDLKYLLLYGQGYSSLKATGTVMWDVYVTRRLDLWVVAALALLALVVAAKKRWTVLVLLLFAATALAFQWKTRSDFDFWKHATYALIFLVPCAVHALLETSTRMSRTAAAEAIASILLVATLATCVAWTGKSFRYDETLFWPSNEPVLAYFEGRLPNTARVLVDDSVFRYYFHPMLRQDQIADPFYFHYEDQQGANAYRKAVADGWFDYLIMNGGMGQEAADLHDAVRPVRESHYALKLAMPDPILGHPIEIWERTAPPASALASGRPSVEIMWPVPREPVPEQTTVVGMTWGAPAGAKVKLEILSNRWYTVGYLPVLPDGSFQSKTPVIFGGQGPQACNHVLRARLYDRAQRPLAVSTTFNIPRQGSGCQ